MFTANICYRADALRLSHPCTKKIGVAGFPGIWMRVWTFKSHDTLDGRTIEKEAVMFIRVIFTALSFCAVFVVVSDNIPGWGNALGWSYILGMLALGVITLKAEQLMAWCDKQLAKKRK
ncbi:hypothetical protein [Vibrio cincinnatiensis]|uniref:hypothetical protein n=1 Tax=Vibrio cincinnatiensis TaxID=675 RepID=UPI001EDE9A01|nr:hypothetical protein [Vibrio cincinnatiensis]